MPTDVIKTIGPSGDYSTLAAWIAACPANLVTSDQRWIGELQNTQLTGSTTLLTISGITTDSTRYVYLRCGAGNSFKDNANVRSNALDYNASNGAAVTSSVSYSRVIYNKCSFTRLEGLQVKATGGGSDGIMNDNSSVLTVSGCIVVASQLALNHNANASYTATNCLLRTTSNGSVVSVAGYSGTASFIGCTAVRATGAASGTAFSKPGGASITGVIKDCAVFNFSTFLSGTWTVSYSATDLTAPAGTGNVGSLTYSSQFVSTTNDWRAASSGSGLVAGTPDTTNIPADISGQTRDLTTPTIGCWELASSPPPPAAWNPPVVARLREDANDYVFAQ